ncbi:MAG: hypothetical protein WA666_11850 [Nitrospirota bacterium]
MAKGVFFTIPKRLLGPTDVEFTVDNDGKALGTLKVSRGSVEWKPGIKGQVYGYHLSWEKFAELMAEYGKKR